MKDEVVVGVEWCGGKGMREMQKHVFWWVMFVILEPFARGRYSLTVSDWLRHP